MRPFLFPAPDPRFLAAKESELIEEAKRGESGAFEELVRRYGPRVHKHLHSLCRYPEDTDDILQNVLLAVYLKIRTFQGTSNFSTWLYRITLNAFLMFERSQRRRRLLFLRDDVLRARMEDQAAAWETDSFAVSYLQGKQLLERLCGLLKELPESYREVLLLREYQDRSIREASDSLNLSISAVKSRHHRARHWLRARLEPDFFN